MTLGYLESQDELTVKDIYTTDRTVGQVNEQMDLLNKALAERLGETEGEEEQSYKEEVEESKIEEGDFGDKLEVEERKRNESIRSKQTFQHERSRFNSVGSKFIPPSEKAFQKFRKPSPEINYINYEKGSNLPSKKDYLEVQKPASAYPSQLPNNHADRSKRIQRQSIQSDSHILIKGVVVAQEGERRRASFAQTPVQGELCLYFVNGFFRCY